ncbi:MAG: TniB family NTP-binding protein [Promethearchaeota archaeon]|jgi:hypothetical protein
MGTKTGTKIKVESKKDNYSHLNEETKEVLIKSKKDKIDWIFDEHFVMYSSAKKIIRDLTIIMNQPQRPLIDLVSMSIIGESGTGKTAIINFFKKLHFKIINKGEYDVFPLIHCVLSESEHGLKAVYKQLLKPFSLPIDKKRMDRYTRDDLEDICINVFRGTEVKIVFMDEFQHAIGKNVQPVLNSLKKVTLESGIPLVPVGTEETLEVLTLDKQIAKRCRPRTYSILRPWKCDENFQVFLRGYEKFLPFPEPSYLASEKLSKEIFKIAYKQDKIHIISQISSRQANKDQKPAIPRIDLRNITQVIKFVSRIAIQQDSPCITLKHLKIYEEDYI